MTAAISNLPASTYTYGSSDTPSTIASGLASAINSKDSSSVTATTVNRTTVQVTSKATGYINWPIVLSTTYNTNAFSSPSFGGATTNVADGYPAVAGVSGSSTYTQFVYLPGGQKIAVVQNGSLVKGTVPLPGGGSAIYSSAGLKYIRHKDWLGSSRLATTWAHGVYSKTAYAPFGESYNQTGTADLSFTGEDQDTSAGVYDFQFRKFDPIAGRWMSPDPSGLYYADQKYPQSLNLYSYLRNDPLRFIDPNGLILCDYGPSDYGGEDYGDADTPEECTSNDGFVPTDNQSATVTADNEGNLVEIDYPSSMDSSTDQIPTTPVPNGPVGPAAIAKCASKLANQYSLAGFIGLQSEGFEQFKAANPELGGWVEDVGNAFLGNTFSGLTDAYFHVAEGNGQGMVHDAELGDVTQGVPVPGAPAVLGGVAGVATEAGINAVTRPGAVLSAVTGAATELGEEGMAGPIGFAKFGIDLGIYLAAARYCANHP